MISKISAKITKIMLSRGIISESEEELYNYGLFMLVSQAIFFIFSCIVGLLLHCFFESIVFYIMFQSIRKYAGGYHANTETLCDILSSISIALCIVIIKLANLYDFRLPLLIIALISTVVIFVLCPLDTPEKPLSDKEYRYFRKTSWLILFVLLTLTILSYFFKWRIVFAPVCLSLVLESILLIAGRIKKIY